MQFKQFHDRIIANIDSRFHYAIKYSGENWINEQQLYIYKIKLCTLAYNGTDLRS